MIGNALLVLTYSSLTSPSTSLRTRGFWVGAIPAAFVKFIFIWLAGMILANSILHGIAKNIMLIISWPQLVTAIAGAAIAYFVLKIISYIK
jgi:hypothetical protein